MNGTLVIRGGKKLNGEVTPIPNKNAILKVIPATLLVKDKVLLKNFPRTSDVEKELAILKKLGAEVDDANYSGITIDCTKVNQYEIDFELASKFRSSILFAGPLLARFGRAKIPMPGGCVLGFRSIAAHIDVFKKVGVSITYEDDYVILEAPKKIKSEYDVWQLETSVTATENFFMYAAGTNSKFTLNNAASEPHVSSLLRFLQQIGADIAGIGSNRVTIKGGTITKGTTFVPQPDFVDIAGYITAAALTRSIIKIKDSNIPEITDNLIMRFSLFNISITALGNDLIVDGTKYLKIDTQNSGIPLAGKDLPKINPAPWPGLPVDVLPVVVTLACKTEGRLLIQNWMYETGLDFIRELNKMGADILMCDPQRVIVTGPVTFKGGEIVSPGIIQACKAIFLAALADDATTVLHGADVLKRRYPDIVSVYKSLGADITEMKKED